MRKIALFLLAGIAGCQTYRSSPLDLRAHEKEWAARDPASASVRAYAERLAQEGLPSADTEPTRFNTSDGLRLDEARAVALFFNTNLRAARLKARVPLAGAAEAGRWADPVLQLDAERIVQSVSHPWVVGGLLNITLPLSGRLHLEKELASSEAGAAWIDVLMEEQRVVAELDSAWSDLRLAEERIALTRSFLADLDVITAQAQKLRAVGELSPIEEGLFRVEQVRRRAEVEYLVARRRDGEMVVKALMGLTPEAAVELMPSLPNAVTDFWDLSKIRTWVETENARVRLTRAHYDVAEKRLELEILRQYPDLTIGGGYGKDEGTNRILGGLGVPIPIFNTNRRAIAEARANRDAARASAQAAYEETITSLARAQAQLAAAKTRRATLEKDLAPIVDEQLKAARNLGRLGNVNTVVVFEAITRAHETRLELLDAAAFEAGALNQLNTLLRPVLGVEPQNQEKP